LVGRDQLLGRAKGVRDAVPLGERLRPLALDVRNGGNLHVGQRADGP
jgi:hypothetical protein